MLHIVIFNVGNQSVSTQATGLIPVLAGHSQAVGSGVERRVFSTEKPPQQRLLRTKNILLF